MRRTRPNKANDACKEFRASCVDCALATIVAGDRVSKGDISRVQLLGALAKFGDRVHIVECLHALSHDAV